MRTGAPQPCRGRLQCTALHHLRLTHLGLCTLSHVVQEIMEQAQKKLPKTMGKAAEKA